MSEQPLTPDELADIRDRWMNGLEPLRSADVFGLLATIDALTAENANSFAKSQVQPLIDKVSEQDAEIKRLTMRAENAELQLGTLRLCVNCGKTADAATVKHYDCLPECIDEASGMSACTFDVTPTEAFEHWRKAWHDQQEEVRLLTHQRDILESWMQARLVRCFHCHEEVLAADPEHWTVCEKHPARLEVGRLTAELKRISRFLESEGLLRQAGCTCHQEIGDSECSIHDLTGDRGE